MPANTPANGAGCSFASATVPPMVSETASNADMAAAISLAASLDLTAADPLLQTVRAGLRDGALLLDGAAVERVSTPCLQVLAAAAIAARQGGIPFRILYPSAVLSAAITDLGLAAAIPMED